MEINRNLMVVGILAFVLVFVEVSWLIFFFIDDVHLFFFLGFLYCCCTWSTLLFTTTWPLYLKIFDKKSNSSSNYAHFVQIINNANFLFLCHLVVFINFSVCSTVCACFFVFKKFLYNLVCRSSISRLFCFCVLYEFFKHFDLH